MQGLGHPYRRLIAQHMRFIAPLGALVLIPALVLPLGLPPYSLASAPVAAGIAYWWLRSRRITSNLYVARRAGDGYEWITPRTEYEHAVADLFDQRYAEHFGNANGRKRPRDLFRLYSPHELYRMVDMFPEKRLWRLRSGKSEMSSMGRISIVVILIAFASVIFDGCLRSGNTPNIPGIS